MGVIANIDGLQYPSKETFEYKLVLQVVRLSQRSQRTCAKVAGRIKVNTDVYVITRYDYNTDSISHREIPNGSVRYLLNRLSAAGKVTQSLLGVFSTPGKATAELEARYCDPIVWRMIAWNEQEPIEPDTMWVCEDPDSLMMERVPVDSLIRI